MKQRDSLEVIETRGRNNRALIVLLFVLVATNYLVWQNENFSASFSWPFNQKKDEVPITRNSFTWEFIALDRFKEHQEPVTLVTLNELGTRYDAGHYDGSCEIINGTNYRFLPREITGIICTSTGTSTEVGVFKDLAGVRTLKSGLVKRGDKTVNRPAEDFDTNFEVD